MPVLPSRDRVGSERPRGATIQQLERELQETRQGLQATVEELETTNEELKSSNEEMLSINEELQSSNEELEASKEETQSITRSANRQHELTARSTTSTTPPRVSSIFEARRSADLPRRDLVNPQLHPGGYESTQCRAIAGVR